MSAGERTAEEKALAGVRNLLLERQAAAIQWRNEAQERIADDPSGRWREEAAYQQATASLMQGLIETLDKEVQA